MDKTDKIIAVGGLILVFFTGYRFVYLGIRKGIIEKKIRVSYWEPDAYIGRKAIYGGIVFIIIGLIGLAVGIMFFHQVLHDWRR